MDLSKEAIANTIDHTFLSPDGTLEDIERLCREAVEYSFATVAIAPDFVKFASENLEGADVGVDVAVGFPLGYTTTPTKVFETIDSIQNGATEVDMVANLVAVKGGRWEKVKKDIEAVSRATRGKTLKVILETCYLSKDEIKKLASICLEIEGVDFIKTSTGFGPEGATVENVELMKRVVGDELKVKAAGGIRTLEDYKEMRQAGASRIGTSSGLAIVDEAS
jgi:deoxyribose-phosphate aldolase